MRFIISDIITYEQGLICFICLIGLICYCNCSNKRNKINKPNQQTNFSKTITSYHLRNIRRYRDMQGRLIQATKIPQKGIGY